MSDVRGAYAFDAYAPSFLRECNTHPADLRRPYRDSCHRARIAVAGGPCPTYRPEFATGDAGADG